MNSTAVLTPTEAINVGDVLVCSWGYDQTNIDFYEVVGVTAQRVQIREIAQRLVESKAGGCDYVAPVIGEYIGATMSRKPQTGWKGGTCVSINSYSVASTWDGEPRYQTASGWGH